MSESHLPVVPLRPASGALSLPVGSGRSLPSEFLVLVACAGGHATLALLLPSSGWVTCLGVASCALVALATAARRARAERGSDAARWWLLSLTFCLWVLGYGLIFWSQYVHNLNSSRADVLDLVQLTRSLPALVALAFVGGGVRSPAVRAFEAAQVVVAFAALVLAVFPLGGSGVGERELLVLFDVTNVFLALLGLVRRFAASERGPREFATATAGLYVAYALVASLANRYVIPRLVGLPGTPVLLLADLPFAVFVWFASSRIHEPMPRSAGDHRLALFADQALPTLFALAPVLLALSFLGTHPGTAFGLAVGALVLAGARAVLQQVGLVDLQAELLDSRQELERLSLTDALTGVANRRCFDEKLHEAARIARRARAPLALVLLDVDHFKAFNDRAGHLAGDQCLAEVARVLRAELRRESDLFARFGGEEFAAVLPFTDTQGALRVAEVLRAAVERAALAHPSVPKGRVSVSVGVASAVAPADGRDLVARADVALYRAKSDGRDCVRADGEGAAA